MGYQRFVVAACSRSGTTYIADLLSRVGLRCTHEEVFRVDGRRVPWQGQLGDSSFAAAEYVTDLGADTLLLHQVRDPLKVIGSWEVHLHNCWNTLDRTYEGRRYPELLEEPTPLHVAMRYWATHNYGIEAGFPARRYRVEDVDEDLILWIADTLRQRTVSRRLAREALAATSRRTNTMAGKPSQRQLRQLAWHHLPEGELKAEVARLAWKYGYDAPRWLLA